MPLNIIAWHDRTVSQHQHLVNENAAKGYRTLSLSVYGSRNDPRYAAVMILRPIVVATQQFFGQSTQHFQQTFNEMSAKGWGPFILTATGPATDPLIASVFQAISPTPFTRYSITEAELVALNRQRYQAGEILHWADAYGTPGDTRYIAVWHPNQHQAGWNCGNPDDALQNAMNDNPINAQRRFEAMTVGGARPAHIALTPNGGVLEVYTDDSVGAWASRSGMTSAEYQANFNDFVGKGLAPVRVAAQGTGSDTRYAAIFAARETPETRTFRSRGPQGMPAIVAIDNAIEQFMKAHRTRGVALAIVEDRRLVYTKGYTWAEPGYSDILPTTLFRQASVSKTLNALAIYRWMQQNPGTTLNTTMQSILNLTTPTGGAPTDSRFGQITLRHLLESTSGLDNGIIWWDVAARDAFNTNLPVTPLQLCRYGATLNLTNNPGATNQVRYGNTANLYLSQAIARLYGTQNAGATAFEQALQTALLGPLNMTRTRNSRSLRAQLPNDEAHYHLDALPIAESLRDNNRPWVPAQYGGWSMENFDGCGGLSSAVVDIARVAALLSVRQNNPLLTTANLDAFLENGAVATETLSGPDAHGYHGWDWVSRVDANNDIYAGSKGGWLPGDQSTIMFTTGGLSYICAINGNTRDGVTTDWLAGTQQAAQAHDWGTTDLFPQYGMPSYPAPARVEPRGRVEVDRLRGFKPAAVVMSQQRVSLLESMPAQIVRAVE